jgi:hypothetical protein
MPQPIKSEFLWGEAQAFVPFKSTRRFIKDIEKSTLKFIWKHKRPRIAKAILSKKAMLEVSQYPTSNHIIKQ